MLAVLLTVHMIACVVLVIAVLLQRSEGGALGMGGGGTGGLISGRGAAGVLVRTTMILAGIFFVTSITMTRLNSEAAKASSTLEQEINRQPDAFSTQPTAPANPSTTTPAIPPPSTTTTPSAPASPAPSSPNPLAPATNPLAPATTPPASSTAPQPAPTQPAPATTQPTTPATPPQNGGSPN